MDYFLWIIYLQVNYNLTGVREDNLVLKQQRLEKNLAPEDQVYRNISRLQRTFQGVTGGMVLSSLANPTAELLIQHEDEVVIHSQISFFPFK